MKKVVLAAASVLMASSLYANNPNTGCGLGNTVIKDQSTTVSQVLAVTTNASASQTFAITSGTFDCKQPSKFVENEKLHRFVNENMDELAMDISVGNGETLNTVATLMNIEDRATFASKLQANFTSIYANENVSSAEVIDNIAKLI